MKKINKRSSHKSLEKLNFSIRIDGSEWDLIKPTIKYDKHRIDQRLNDPWTHIVNRKIWCARKLPCAFVFKKQKFYKSKGFPYFEIFGGCNDQKCYQFLTGKCEKPDDDGVTIEIECYNTVSILHTKKISLRGKARIEAKRILLAEKPAQYKQHLADELLNDSGANCPLLQTTAVFTTARQESRDDVIKVKYYPGNPITSTMAMMDDFPSIRELSTIPFYVWYWSKNQLELWNEIAELGSFVSIDASGCFIKVPTIIDDTKTSDVFFYNIVTHINNKIYTLCQCLSSIHDTNSIFSWLRSWVESGASVPNEVVIDGSSALLNAVSLTFNGVYYNAYLLKCFQFLIGKTKTLPSCLIKRDRAHLIKGLCQLKCFEQENWVKKDFYIRCIGFCLYISDLKLLEEVMIAIFIMCQSEYCDEDTECFKRKTWLTDKIATFDFDVHYGIDNTDDPIKEKNYEYLKSELELSESGKIYDYIYNIYNNCLIMCSTNGNEFCIPNNYHLPEIEAYLISLFSHFPAWTNVLNKYYSSRNYESTSARSECYYRIMRQMNYPTSLNRFLLSHMKDIDGATKLGRTAIKQLKQKIKVQKVQSNFQNPCMKAEIQTVTMQKNNAAKGTLLNSSSKEIKNNGFLYSTIGQKKNEILIADNDEQVLRNSKVNTVEPMDFEHSFDNLFKSITNLSVEKNVPYFIDHLMNICMRPIKVDFTVAIYDSNDLADNIFSIKLEKDHFVLWASDLNTLNSCNCISGCIIDNFMIVSCIKNWKNVSFISTSHTNYMLGDLWSTEKSENWLMYNTNFEFSGLIFLPYCYSSHWCLLVVNVEEQTILHLDPMAFSDDSGNRAIEAFLKYLIECESRNKINLCKITWRRIYVTDHAYQSDSYNCGVYIMFYMSKLGQEKSLKNVNFDPNEYRRFIAKMIICNSKDISTICIYCERRKDAENSNIICKICNRWAHLQCITLQTEKENNCLFNDGICFLCNVK